MRCAKLTGQLKEPKDDQRLPQRHCHIPLFSALPLFPPSLLLTPLTSDNRTSYRLLAFGLWARCFLATRGPAGDISAFRAPLLKIAHQCREPAGSGGWLTRL